MVSVEGDERLEIVDVDAGRQLVTIGFQIGPVRQSSGRIS